MIVSEAGKYNLTSEILFSLYISRFKIINLSACTYFSLIQLVVTVLGRRREIAVNESALPDIWTELFTSLLPLQFSWFRALY